MLAEHTTMSLYLWNWWSATFQNSIKYCPQVTPSYDRFSWFWLQLCLNFTISKYRPVARYYRCIKPHTHSHLLTHVVCTHTHIYHSPREKENTVSANFQPLYIVYHIRIFVTMTIKQPTSQLYKFSTNTTASLWWTTVECFFQYIWP